MVIDWLLFLAEGVCLLFAWRSWTLRGQMREVFDEIGRAGNHDVDNGRDPMWRLLVLRTVSREAMLVQFWRPARSFFPPEVFDPDYVPKVSGRGFKAV